MLLAACSVRLPRLYLVGLGIFAVGSVLVALSPTWNTSSRPRRPGHWRRGGCAHRFCPGRQRRTPGTPRPLPSASSAARRGRLHARPGYGGAIVELANWRWLFWLNIPQVLVLAPWLLLLRNVRQTEARVDYLGGFLLLATLLAISLGLSQKGLIHPGHRLALRPAGVGRGTGRRPGPVGTPGCPALAAAPPLPLPGVRLRQPYPGPGRRLLAIALVTVPLLANTVMEKDPFTGALWLLRMTPPFPPAPSSGPVAVPRRQPPRHHRRPAAYRRRNAVVQHLEPGHRRPGADPASDNPPASASAWSSPPSWPRPSNAAPEQYHATASSLIVVSRLLGMTLGLAALAAWGLDQFQTLTADLILPPAGPRRNGSRLQPPHRLLRRRVPRRRPLLFHRFFRIAATVALLALIPALLLRRPKRGKAG